MTLHELFVPHGVIRNLGQPQRPVVQLSIFLILNYVTLYLFHISSTVNLKNPLVLWKLKGKRVPFDKDEL